MNDDVRFILEQALLAPSGDNTQPWHWVVRGNTLELWSRFPNEDIHSLYSSSSNSGSSAYLALGASIENACIAASTRGYEITVTYFPDHSQPTLAATLTLVRKSAAEPDHLARALASRVTNRGSFRCDPLTRQDLERLRSVGTEIELGRTFFLQDRASINALAKIASLQDELTFSSQDLHDYIFSNVNWTKRADEQRRIGFYFPTLGAPPFAWLFMRLMAEWEIAHAGSFFGLHRLIALWQRCIYRKAGAYGLIVAREDTPEGWMRVGRLTERLWIAANDMGLSLHPLNGIVLLNIGIETEAGKRAFSQKQQNDLKEAHRKIVSLFGVQGATLAFMFRIGYGKPPAARTSRRPFEQMVDVSPEAAQE